MGVLRKCTRFDAAVVDQGEIDFAKGRRLELLLEGCGNPMRPVSVLVNLL
jgi:hypothetical protein